MDDGLRHKIKQVLDLMKNLSLNLLVNARNVQGHGRKANHPNGDGGQGNGGKRWRNMPTCYSCGEIGHINHLCNKTKRMGGDMYPLPAHFPNWSNDFGIEIKMDKVGSSRLTAKEKGNTKVLSVIKLEKIEPMEDPVVMTIRRGK